MGGKGKTTFQKVLQKVTHQSDASPIGLKKYGLVIVGGHMGGILTRHFEQYDHGHTTTFVAFDSNRNVQYFLRPIYENQITTENDYVFSPKISMANYVASSEGVGVQSLQPENNSITLENGQVVEYDQLVLSFGLKDNFDDIKGFRKAWEDDYIPVFCSINSDKWTIGHNKYTRWIGNYTHGDAFFYIPKFPFRGEISGYHFLMAHDYWEYYRKIGKVSPKSSLTVVNANDSFTQYDKQAHDYILKQCQKRGIGVLFNTQLVEVKGEEQKLTLKNAEGRTEERDFGNLYVLPRGILQKSVIDAGLADEKGFLAVDPVTLQSKKFENIWGLGDICGLPITKSYWATFHQLHALRNNLVRAFKGLPPNAPYDGYTKVPFFIGSDKLIYFEKDYKGPRFWNMVGANGGFMASLMYKHYKGFSKKQQKVHLGKNKGPPYGNFTPFGKYFKGSPIVKSETVQYVPAPKA